jgi:pimeloyl-ACP methyl ester carboxylesterase
VIAMSRRVVFVVVACAVVLTVLVLVVPGRFRGPDAIVSAPAGQVLARDLVAPIGAAVGLDANELGIDPDLRVDAEVALAALDAHLDGDLVRARLGPQVIILDLDERGLGARREAVCESLRGWVASLVPAVRPARFGLTVVTAETDWAPLASLPADTRRVVILVHGLDDPGWMWRDLAPALLEAGHAVLRFEYPNDQAVAGSADLLAAHLESLRGRGIERVDLVAHSMGGLVSRDVLTRPAHYAGDGGGGERFPAVDRLLMLGTPNGGSEFARLRGVAELREQVVRWFRRSGTLDGGMADGRGEAGADLIPGSPFLRELNGRPAPRHTRYTIIAGRASPVGDEELAAFAEQTQRIAESDAAPEWLAEWLGADNADGPVGLLQAAVDGVGDGVVTLDSATLPGVEDLVIVEANHLTMLTNPLGGDRTPPAIPIVLERLADR